MFPSKVDWPVENSMLKCKHVKQDTHGCTVEEANATSSNRHICQDFTLTIVSGHGPVTMPHVCMYISTYVHTYVTIQWECSASTGHLTLAGLFGSLGLSLYAGTSPLLPWYLHQQAQQGIKTF